MKKVPCSYEGCSERRVHYERQDEMRPRQMVEVKDDYEGQAFCCFTCAMLAGSISVKLQTTHIEPAPVKDTP